MAERTCSIEGCSKAAKTRGWCGMHYERWHRHGDPLTTLRRPPVRGGTALERCVQLIRFEESGCWTWTGQIAGNGYGRFAHEGSSLAAHRVVYELLVGPIPEAMTLDHTCHNLAASRSECSEGNDCLHRRCVNPDHLEPKTSVQNAADSPNHQTNWTSCIRGHEFTPANTYVTKDGGRKCRTCRAAATRRYLQKRGA